MANISLRETGMGNDTINTHLVLHICDDIHDHGVPESVNSAYAESAHITLAKRTSANTQKCDVSFTRQAAKRYIENLAISRASCDVEHDRQRCSITAGEAEMCSHEGLASGRKYTISAQVCGDFLVGKFQWQRHRKSDNHEKDHLYLSATNLLARHILPHDVPSGKVNCFTELISGSGDRFRAHPNYDKNRGSAVPRWIGQFEHPG